MRKAGGLADLQPCSQARQLRLPVMIRAEVDSRSLPPAMLGAQVAVASPALLRCLCITLIASRGAADMAGAARADDRGLPARKVDHPAAHGFTGPRRRHHGPAVI
jgi:hypothetical protein